MKEKLVKIGLTEELAEKVLDNFGDIIDGNYITKERFNEINKEKKLLEDTVAERDKQLQTLKDTKLDKEELERKINELQEANKTAKEEADKTLAAERKTNAIKLELIGKVHNPNVVMNMLNLDSILMDENGKVKSGLKESLKDLQKTDSYLFIEESGNNQVSNADPYVKGATPKDGEAGKPNTLSKGEEFAKSLAANHNASLKNSADSIYFGE